MKVLLKIIVIAALASAAYVLGAKAGRRRYREIRDAARSFWNDPQVKKARKRAVKQAKQAADAAEKAAEKAVAKRVAKLRG
ncbi:hypothetical protein [Lysinibacter cavernae]|uniref:Uncharacterized protein (UPF0333 family) n=1 Tax=Lysinibacter cavernae TaxID=1640652 RepID=A0A7X5R1I8_9MICO|nr:hypothetical protein [Lysinibacter cavernae]NIH53732.1 uncharacterized protein (UPF0333 family) [Lysinibacter cavernae]